MRQLSKSFVKELTVGKLSDLLQCIIHDAELDLQIRGNYINVYYKGGNILRIKPRSFEFDEMYFNDSKVKISSEAKKDAIIHTELIKQKEALIEKLKDNKPKEYFCEAKAVMDKWALSISEKKTFEEKKEQQEIALANRKDTDFVVLDLEYAVSRNSEFNHVKTAQIKKEVPRFDIIAIHNGRLVVIELKKGLGAVPGTSGVKPHMDCFEYTIGQDINGLFIREMQTLLAQKKALGLLDKQLEIKDEKPLFMFAFADENGKDEFAGFVEKCREKDYKDEFIYLDNDHKLRRKKI